MLFDDCIRQITDCQKSDLMIARIALEKINDVLSPTGKILPSDATPETRGEISRRISERALQAIGGKVDV